MLTSDSFKIFSTVAKMQSFDILLTWQGDFMPPSFDASKALRSDQDFLDLAQLNAELRDLNLLQTSAGVQARGKLLADQRVVWMSILKVEVDRCLNQSIKTVNTHTLYIRTINVVLTETGRMFLAGRMMSRQFEVESETKDRLWNLRLVEYGSEIMASVAHAGKWWAPIPVKNKTGKVMGALGRGMDGAYIGFAVGGPVGAAIGGAVGFVVGIALEFF
jgi:hypothetical protein